MNIKDVAMLKNRDIHGDFLLFEGAKTERAMRSDPRPISVYINEDIKRIIERWGNKRQDSNSYIFPILEVGDTPQRTYEIVQLFVEFVNKWMKEIAKKLGIDKKVTTYVARHTFRRYLRGPGLVLNLYRKPWDM